MASYLQMLLSELRRSYLHDDYEVIERGRVAYAAGAVAGRPRFDRSANGRNVVWAPAPAPLAASCDLPFVLTVHDLSFEHRRADFTRYERLFHSVARPRSLARRAARVIAVSNHVRNELLAEWHLEPEHVVAIPSGPGRPPAPGAAPRPGIPGPYVLAVGALEPRKGTDLLISAHAQARKQGLRAALVLAGQGTLDASAPDVTALGYVPDDRLEGLYADALAVVCASREEGFGFTPLEALARGTPAIVADLPPFRETLGAAALRFPPGDASALAEAMLTLEREPGLAARLAAAGREPLARLSWERAARDTRAVLADAAAAGA